MADEISIVVKAEDQFSSVLGNFGNIMTGIKSVIDLAGQAFETFVAPVIDFGKEAILTAARVDELAAVNGILAENAGLSASQIPPLVEAIRKQGIEAGVAETTVAQLIRANIDLGLATEIARVAQDAAVISGKNSSETLDNIIYGITTLNPLVLRHAGIIVDLQLAYKQWAEENDRSIESLTTAEKQQIAMNAVLEAGTQIAGAYAIAMEEPGKVLRSFPRIFDDIKVAIGEPFQEAFGNVILKLYEMSKAFSKSLVDGGELYPVLQNIAGAFSSIGDYIVNVLSAFEDTGSIFSPEFQEALTSFLPQEIQDKFYAFVDAIQRMFESISNGESIFVSFTQLFEDFVNIIDWNKISNDIANAIDSIDWAVVGDSIFRGIANVLNGIGTIISEIDWAALATSIGNALKDLFAGLSGYEGWDEMVNIISTVIEYKRDSIIQGIRNSFQSAIEEAISTVNLVTEPIINAIVNWVYLWKDWIGDPLASVGMYIVDKIGEMILTWKDRIGDPLREFAAFVVNEVIVPSFEEALWNAKDSIGDPLAAIGNSIVEGLANGIVDAFWLAKEHIGDPLAAIGTSVIEGIGDAFINAFWWAKEHIGDPLRSFGLAVVDGIVDAFWLAKEYIGDPLREFGLEIIRIVKNILGISSPSTVFADIGRNIILGLMSGFNSMIGVLLDFVNNMVGLLLAPFAPILDLLGIDLNTSSGGSTGGHTSTLTGTTSTAATSANTVNNYFYGTVVFGDMGQLGYDCPPSQLMSTGSQTLVTSGI